LGGRNTYKLEMIWKEKGHGLIEVLKGQMPGTTEENHELPQ
jgi:hypothetical protein